MPVSRFGSLNPILTQIIGAEKKEKGEKRKKEIEVESQSGEGLHVVLKFRF